MNQTLKELNSQLEEMENQLGNLVGAIKAIQEAKDAAAETSGALKTAQEAYSQLTKDTVSALKDHVDVLGKSTGTLVGELQKIDKDLENLELAKVLENVSLLDQKVSELTKAIDAIGREGARSAEISELSYFVENGLSDLKTVYESIHGRLSSACDDLSELKTAGESIHGQLSSACDSISSLGQKLDALSQTAAQLSQSEKKLQTLVMVAIGTGALAAVLSLVSLFI